MKKISADHVFLDRKLQAGVVIVSDNEGNITSIDKVSEHDTASVKKYDGCIVPGFVNAHCHLELSYMKGHVQPGNGLVEFIIELLTKRFLVDQHKEELINEADEEMKKNGIVAIGDISNGTDTLKRKKVSSLIYQTFVECYGFGDENADKFFDGSVAVFNEFKTAGLRTSLVPHAPYSISRKLFSKIEAWTKEHPSVISVHNEESEEELKFCMNGEGDFKRMIEFFKQPPRIFVPYGTRSLEGMWKYINSSSQRLLVHNTFMKEEDFETIKEKKDTTWLCTCPNANIYIENTLPDYYLWRKNTNNICIGTDSLASNYQLSIWEEVKTIHKYFPEIDAIELLSWATINGARALQLDAMLGRIEKGKRPGLVLLEYDINNPEGIWKSNPRIIDSK